MKHYVDIETWERKDNYNFFRDFLNPTISITSEVTCGGAKKRAKEAKQSFFLHYLYAILHAANEVKEFRFRIDREGKVVYYDKVDVLTPIKIDEEGHFYTVRIPYHKDFDTFYKEAQAIIQNIPTESKPYSNEEQGSVNTDFDMILLSATPDLYFTSITATQEFRHGSNYPLMNAGKAVIRDNEWVMPIGMTVHHGFIDGHHLARFFQTVEAFLSK
ncbi:chloramphenicol acetyltransferase [Bacteroides sp.]|uniref:chloramphenicol acetyltransferase n=1 Tax=Bacteroides sp. TaxID=29523 RepID=UPI001B4D75CA|nr:chloramphenicol acetyltransferase [Bacteroides sp.]MBP6065302.1 chloramphenicol acetyltransferase [Bacteroides sp.]MBP6067258.1 chloramphenicol acetyltransferase [Bacteroides sp.]MBP6936812.1 chloramphenicol acetyltransferase [Bacteroides sp.]MBP8621460.1 chloramphenicol acetyltransferase [Bacteroides sp.]MBP9507644.1 chloramphenicol acetyltransferase [Bacteroides sp.]